MTLQTRCSKKNQPKEVFEAMFVGSKSTCSRPCFKMNDPRRLVVLRARGLTVTVLYDDLVCINARLETSIEHTLWSFLGCGRERRVAVVRLNAWTTHATPFTTTIEVDDEEEGSEVLESILAQIPDALRELEDEEDIELKEVNSNAACNCNSNVPEEGNANGAEEEESEEEDDDSNDGEQELERPEPAAAPTKDSDD